MDEQAARDILSGERRGICAAILRAGLAVGSVPYAVAVRLRRWGYRKGILASRSAGEAHGAQAVGLRAVPVISVGNITTGGTGKTPMVAWVVQHLREGGRRPAILMRGYKATGGKSDEAEMLRRICADSVPAPSESPTPEPARPEDRPSARSWSVPVIVNPDRVAGARQAVEQGADVLVMDDGFQHRRLRRDLDIVLIDATNPFGYGWCLPRGLLREPVSSLRDAGAIVITRSDAISTDSLQALKDRLARLSPRASLHAAVHRPTRIIHEDGAQSPAETMEKRRSLAFCGIGNPRSFFDTLKRLGADLVACRALEDHVEYTKEVIEWLRQEAIRCGAELLITTQKDAVKLAGAKLPLPLWILEVRMEVVGGREELLRKILQAPEAEQR